MTAMPHPKRLRVAAVTADFNPEYYIDDSRSSKLSKKKQRAKQNRSGLLRNMFNRTGNCPSADRAQPAHSHPDRPPLVDASGEDRPRSARIDVDNSPWARPNILALDGGGVRGFATLLVIEELMKKIKVCQPQASPVKLLFV